MISIWSRGSKGGAPMWSYWSAGITNTIGPAMGIEALKYISYPAQVLLQSRLASFGVFWLVLCGFCNRNARYIEE